MNSFGTLTRPCVICLTLIAAAFSGCSIIQRHYGESCNSHAYVQTPVAEYINKRFQAHAPVRLAIIPFSVPANLAGQDNEHVGLGVDLASKVHAELLENGSIPIVEILNREDWPGKKEEFTHGNFGALQFARDAGYDLVLVGMVEPIKSIDSISAQTKLIEVESGITVWFGRTTVDSIRDELNAWSSRHLYETRRPDLLYSAPSITRLARCIRKDVVADRVIPE